MPKKKVSTKKPASSEAKKKFKLGTIKKIEAAPEAEDRGFTRVYAYTNTCSGSCGSPGTFCC